MRVGQVTAVALGIAGFLFLHNVLLLLIAAFVFFAAEGELRQSGWNRVGQLRPGVPARIQVRRLESSRKRLQRRVTDRPGTVVSGASQGSLPSSSGPRCPPLPTARLSWTDARRQGGLTRSANAATTAGILIRQKPRYVDLRRPTDGRLRMRSRTVPVRVQLRVSALPRLPLRLPSDAGRHTAFHGPPDAAPDFWVAAGCASRRCRDERCIPREIELRSR